jgi:branched-chain amino acid transport system substrate-binding protein
VAQNGSTVAGRKVEVILKDDGGVPDATKRIAQELIVNDKVDVLLGFGITPSAFATAPIATQSKTPMVVSAAATSAITERSPYIVRTSFTLPQVTVPIADWAAKHGIKKAVTFVSDYGPGLDAEKFFKSQFTLNGARSSRRSARRCGRPTSRRSCKRSPTRSRMRCSASCRRGRARRS